MSALVISPEAVGSYLAHIADGNSLRDCAGLESTAASTILRRVQRCEALRDHPEWDALFAAMEAARLKRHDPATPVDREAVAAAMALTEVDVHAEMGGVLSDMRRAGSFIITGDAPRAVVMIAGTDPGRSMSRAALICALAYGWVRTAGITSTRLRRFVATPAIIEAAYPPGATPGPAYSDRTGLEPLSMMPIDVLARRAPEIITPAHAEAAARFQSIFAARYGARKAEWRAVTEALPGRTVTLLEEVVGNGTGLETVEKRMGLPARSAKVLLAFALETFGHVNPRPDVAA